MEHRVGLGSASKRKIAVVQTVFKKLSLNISTLDSVAVDTTVSAQTFDNEILTGSVAKAESI